MSQKYTVATQTTLLPFLFEVLQGWSKKTIKQRLRGASVSVNGKVETQHNAILLTGDEVAIGAAGQSSEQKNTQRIKLDILYQDKDLIAINKPAGLLSVGTAKENRQHALALLRTQLTRGKHSVRLWPVHRLDRETSGILLFATSKEIREAVMSDWHATEKVYLAVVEGVPDLQTGTVSEALRPDTETYRMHVGAHPDAKPAVTHYEIKESTAHRALLEVRIETGRQHQIRAHMAWLGHSIVGDERYGTRGKRMGLHASRLSFCHPVNGERIVLEVQVPHDFFALLQA